MKQNICTLFLLVTSATLCGCGPSSPDPAGALPLRAVAPADFYLYSCLSEYLKAHALPEFDGSMAYAVEHSDMAPEQLDQLHRAARTQARSIRAPDRADPEHGQPAVLALCREGAREFTAR